MRPGRASTTATTRLTSLRGGHDRPGAISPAESIMSSATTGTKRKERSDELERGEETNISVYVRCRGRSEREVKENSNVVLRTEGVQGNLLELAMGPNALNNKTYSFDGVFSPAAGQTMIFDEVVKPIVDEMLAGYNCTIFAYGQTGTGKTYTMSGDMSETLGILSDQAGIIPRVLKSLFEKLQVDSGENCVKVSFIELYNEELRDLISVEDSAKLKIYDDTKKGHATTVVQGMEEKHINTASEGIRVLQEGSLKRQVAATKCNDLSSRSHTVFTITAYVRVPGDNGGADELVSAGKLNLVDLAGSENIQRSGAENKRAAEAGLINKSLLTLGRVINALVDRSQHIPYRESKLTRLLQDSLGGRTKTCIVATVSPAKSNLEETISTLDYAFRAKNIRNRPRINQPINKKALLKDFANEIEKLKSELICHRQRNGVYLANEAYEDLTTTSESRRIMLEEQAAKLETTETSLRNKAQELLMLTATFMGLKKDHDGVRAQLDDTKEVLEQAELILANTRRSLAEETHLRKAHQETEERLVEVGGKLLTTLERTVGDVDGLRAKNKRKSDVQALNRVAWTSSQAQVAEVTSLVENKVLRLRDEQSERIASMSGRMRGFVDEELRELSETQAFLEKQLALFGQSKGDLLERGEKSKDDMDDVLEEIKVIRDSVKERVGESLRAISGAAERISEDVLSELDTFHNQLHNSYSSLGKDCKTIFEDLTRHLVTQRSESDRLRRQLQGAARTMMDQSDALAQRVQDVVDEERRQAAVDREQLMAQIGALISAQAEAQESRLAEKAALLQKGLRDASSTLGAGVERYDESMEAWDKKEGILLEDVKSSRDTLKTRLKDDWTTASEHSSSIQATTKSVHAQTVRVVDEQITDLDVQMAALDDFVGRARSENAQHHEAQVGAVQGVASTVEASYEGIGSHFKSSFERAQALAADVDAEAGEARQALEPLEEELCAPLAGLRGDVGARALREYVPTGSTPAKVTYRYPKELPHTESHEVLLAGLRGEEVAQDLPSEDSPSKASPAPAPAIFEDETLRMSLSPGLAPIPEAESTWGVSRLPTPGGAAAAAPGGGEERNPMSMGLREINPNLTASFTFDAGASTMSMPEDVTMPMMKRGAAGKKGARKGAAGRENLVFEMPKRKSPRLN
ncbi:probable kinesin-related protein bimC [Cephalotrichum gorgonifer]|uniref:Probable kinesin-related protein bimC n=1 Tax=Cephalotrichum gorgonifer TaxID=2041049 RepID=A0AAE8SV81_9PEZI|nr:probable kinesin-related protein bimC [Cephalotrichum gorgonifer]